MARLRFFYSFDGPSIRRHPHADLNLSNLSSVDAGYLGEAFMAGSIPLPVYVDYLLHKLYQDFHHESYVQDNLPPSPHDIVVKFASPFTLGLAVRYCALGKLKGGLKLPDRSELRRCLLLIQDRGDGKEEPAKEAGSKYGGIPTEMLEEPLLRELIVVMAMTLWNKDLAKAIVADFPPTPHADLLFGLERLGPGIDGGGGGGGGGHGPETFLASLAFGPPGPTPIRDKDNGSDLVAAFIRAGWTTPYPVFLIHACHSGGVEAGIGLIQVLADPYLRRWVAACGDMENGGDPEIAHHFLYASVCGARHAAVISTLLGLAMPLIRASPTLGVAPFLPRLKRYLSHAAARNGPDHIQAVIDNCADDLFGVDRGAIKKDVMFEIGSDTPEEETTALHYAAVYGNVESVKFLLERVERNKTDDVKKVRDGRGRNAYLSATLVLNRERSLHPEKVEPIQKLEQVVALFEEYGWNVRSGCCSCAVL